MSTSLFHVTDVVDTHLEETYGRVKKVWKSAKEVVRGGLDDRVLSVVHENVRMVIPVRFETHILLFRAAMLVSAIYIIDGHAQTYCLCINRSTRKCLI